MALFGKDWASKLATIGATLQDVGSNLNGGPSGYLMNLQSQRQQQAKEDQQKAALADLQGMFAPQTTPAQVPQQGNLSPFAAALQDQANGGQAGPLEAQQHPMTLQDAIPYLTKAAAAGVNISPYLDILQAANPQKQYQGYNREGGVLVLNPQTGKTEWIADQPGPLNDLDRQYKQAQIDALNAQRGLRENQGDYWNARAAQPYAPPRKSSGGGPKGGLSNISTADLIAALKGN